MKKYIIVTGGSGDIGSEIVKFLIKKDYKVINLDNKKNSIINKDIININCDLDNIKKIFLSFKKIKEITNNIHGLVNCAGITRPGETLKYNFNPFSSEINL